MREDDRWTVIGRPVRTDQQKVVDTGILDPRKYLGCKKIYGPNPALLSKSSFYREFRIIRIMREELYHKLSKETSNNFFERALYTKSSLKGLCIKKFFETALHT